MAKDNRPTTTDTPAPTPVRISYIHPVDLLLHRLPNALIAVSAIPYGEKSLHPALRAIELARGVAFGVGQSLRFGMGDRAGVIETELRTGLDTLHLGAYGVSRDAPPVVKRQCWDAYDQLEQLYTKLSRLATEPEPIPWSKKLRGFYNALLRVKDGMRTLYEAAEDDAKDPVELWKQVCRTVLPDFSEVAADILPQLVYAAEADGSGDLYLDRFPDHVFNCCQELMCWGTNRRERPKEDIRFEPSHEYRAARADREALLWWIENAPEAVEAEPSSEGKKSAGQLAGAVPEDDRATEIPQLVPRTADEAVKLNGNEWATYKQLAESTGMTESALRSAAKRALDNGKLMKENDIKPLPLTRSGTPRQIIRIRGLWPHLSCARERSEK